MPNRFEQSAPPSLEKIYRGLPVGPWGVLPYSFRDRDPGSRRQSMPPWGRIRTMISAVRARLSELASAVRTGSSAASARARCAQGCQGL